VGPSGSWRSRLIAAAVVLAAGMVGWYWLWPDAAETALPTAATAVDPTPAPRVAGSGTAPYSAAGLAAREQQLQLWSQRQERAEQVYRTYLEATRYPPTARPIAEHPDQMQPFAPVQEDLPMRDAEGRPVAGLRLRSTQDRVFVGNGESVRMTLQAFDGSGAVVPLQVRRAAAQTLPDGKALVQLVRVEVPFTDDGAGADDVAGDQIHAGRLTPGSQGFAGQAGSIRVRVDVEANGQAGTVGFDIIYAPDQAGRWAGVREAMVEGDLHFYLKAEVPAAGRYVASARVRDASGVPFALLQFNDVLPAGSVEFDLALPGLLVHDRQPTFPLQLVDVDAFQLKPDAFPDRVPMPRLPGVVHLSQRYAIDAFSSRQWQSEERDRYLAEYARDVVRAEGELARLRR
jgi:hypothetical protein